MEYQAELAGKARYEITVSVGVEADNADEAVTRAALELSEAFCKVRNLDTREESEGILPAMHVCGTVPHSSNPAWKEWEDELDNLNALDNDALALAEMERRAAD